MKYRSRYDIIRLVIEFAKHESISETRALHIAGTNPDRWKEIRNDAFNEGIFEKTPEGRVKATRKALQWAEAWDKAKAIASFDTPEADAIKTGEKPKRKATTTSKQ